MSLIKSRVIALLLVTAVPDGSAFAAGAAAGSPGAPGAVGAGVGAAGTGSAAVGGGPPAGRVGGGPPAGAIGEGTPGAVDPQGNGAAGTGNPSVNAAGARAVPAENPAAGLENAPTTGGVIGGASGVPVPAAGASPPVLGQATQDRAVAPKEVEGVAEQSPAPTTGLARPGPDGISTRTVAPRPCGTAAHETDGTTTCVGISGAR